MLFSSIPDTVIPVLVNRPGDGRDRENDRWRKKLSLRAQSKGSISMTSEGEGEYGVRVVAEFQSGIANQVINHSGCKGPSKNRLMRSRVNQVQARLPAVSVFRWTAKYSKTGSAIVPLHQRPLIAVTRCALVLEHINDRSKGDRIYSWPPINTTEIIV